MKVHRYKSPTASVFYVSSVNIARAVFFKLFLPFSRHQEEIRSAPSIMTAPV